MPTSGTNNNPPDPLANLKDLVNIIAGFFLQLITQSTLVIGVGFLILLFILYLFFKLFGLG